MIIGHVVGQGWKRNIIFSFHMPLFIIVSGMFYKEKSLKENLKNICLKLILPYVICALVVALLKCTNIQLLGKYIIDWIKQILFSYSYWGNIEFSQDVTALGVLWFFPLLAFTRLIFIVLKKISKDNSVKLLFLSVLISYIGYLLGMKKYWLPFSIDAAMFCIMFYYIGYILNKTKILEKILSDNKTIIIILLIWIISIKFSWIELAIRRYPDGAFSILSAICGTITILKISQVIEKHLKYLGNILAWYGKNSMFILLVHHIESNFIKYSKIFITTNDSIYKIEVSSVKILNTTTVTLIINQLRKISSYIKNKQNFKLKVQKSK